MGKRAHTLSVIIISFNEEDRIRNCLESVKDVADEIIVVDSGSVDKTVEIAREYTDKVIVTDWPGYGPQKQRALDLATGDWVLSIDCDEVLDARMQQALHELMNQSRIAEVAFKLPWGVTLYGKRLNWGRSARAPLRLFRREGARFTMAQVHETVLVPEGKIGKLPGRLLHYTHRDFGHALEKSAKYAWLGAKKRYEAGRHGGGLFVAWLRSKWVFFHIYILRGGFLDGQVGFLVAMTYSQGSFNKYAGLWTLRRIDKMKARQEKKHLKVS